MVSIVNFIMTRMPWEMGLWAFVEIIMIMLIEVRSLAHCGLCHSLGRGSWIVQVEIGISLSIHELF